MRSLSRDPRKLAAIYAGGVLGALIRVGLAQGASPGPGQGPAAALGVSTGGALLVGYFFALFRDPPPEKLHPPLLGVGLCGTLTTFSTMQLELYEMVDGGRLRLAAGYAADTIPGGYPFLALGIDA